MYQFRRKKRKYSKRKAAEAWGLTVTQFEEAKASGQLHSWILADFERMNSKKEVVK